MTGRFLICALPRSRTAWLANWLSNGRVACGHELTTAAGVPADLQWLLAGPGAKYSGNADTAQALVLPALLRLMPGCKVVVIRRPVADVVRSLQRLGLPCPPGAIAALDRHLDAAAAVPGALSLEYDALQCESAGRALLAHVAPEVAFERRRWAMLQGMNVQLTRERLREVIRLGEERAETFYTEAN